MKFLEHLFDSINALLEKLFDKIHALIPHFIFDLIAKIKHLPHDIKHILGIYVPKIRIFFLKFIGYIQHYITIIRGSITAVLIYVRSEEFKKDKKTALIKKPLLYIKDNPVKVLTTFCIVGIFIWSFALIGINSNKIILGAKTRAPASMEKAEVIEEPKEDSTTFILHHHRFEVKIGSAERGGHGAGGEVHEEEVVVADVHLKLYNSEQKELMEEMEDMIDTYLEALEISVPNLPVVDLEKVKIEAMILKELNEGFHTFTHSQPIKNVSLHFHQETRPEYYRKLERSYTLQNVDLQVFEEDLKRNHQVYIDFTVVASNRNVVLFLQDHEVLIRDRLSTNVEPILPHLPIEDEGKRIIKDKIRDEINEILKKENIEGKIMEVYLDFSMSS